MKWTIIIFLKTLNKEHNKLTYSPKEPLNFLQSVYFYF